MNFSDIQAMFYEAKGIDLKTIMHDIVSFENLGKKDIKALNKWLKQHSCQYKMEKVIMYHGTASRHDIEDNGINTTTAKTKRSLQSATGFVYLSLYPDAAKRFGEMAYPNEDVTVYAVEVPIRDLLPDHDQLKNKRLWGEYPPNTIGTTLADSLIYGSGARVKRYVQPYEVNNINHLLEK